MLMWLNAHRTFIQDLSKELFHLNDAKANGF